MLYAFYNMFWLSGFVPPCLDWPLGSVYILFAVLVTQVLWHPNKIFAWPFLSCLTKWNLRAASNKLKNKYKEAAVKSASLVRYPVLSRITCLPFLWIQVMLKGFDSNRLYVWFIAFLCDFQKFKYFYSLSMQFSWLEQTWI